MREHSVTGTLQRSRMCVCDVATNLRSQPLVSTALQPELSKLFGDSRLRLANGSPLLKTACDLPNCFWLLLTAFDCFWSAKLPQTCRTGFDSFSSAWLLIPYWQVSYEQAAIVEHVVTSNWGWKYIDHIETDQKPQTASDSQGLKMNVLRQRDTREAEKLRTVCVRPKSKQEKLYSAQVTHSVQYSTCTATHSLTHPLTHSSHIIFDISHTRTVRKFPATCTVSIILKTSAGSSQADPRHQCLPDDQWACRGTLLQRYWACQAAGVVVRCWCEWHWSAHPSLKYHQSRRLYHALIIVRHSSITVHACTCTLYALLILQEQSTQNITDDHSCWLCQERSTTRTACLQTDAKASLCNSATSHVWLGNWGRSD